MKGKTYEMTEHNTQKENHLDQNPVSLSTSTKINKKFSQQITKINRSPYEAPRSAHLQQKTAGSTNYMYAKQSEIHPVHLKCNHIPKQSTALTQLTTKNQLVLPTTCT